MTKVLAGRLPFEECRRDPAVIYQVVVLQNRPKRPPVNDLSDDIWALMEACWNMDPGQRPNMLTTLTRLSSACGRPSRPEPGIGNINSAEFNVADSNLPASDVETGSVPVIEIVPPTPHIVSGIEHMVFLLGFLTGKDSVLCLRQSWIKVGGLVIHFF